ncbi:MAG: tRNA (adenosine(37)-N6)-threonylcarbamoyltransferase complex transferase subunit TsaD [Candidatus Liptonbacteria bacterium]|nr:tRNA (adenosine(37)-N6)-threonylcarbamoyltransferase complex transferase subunit TsaD [Candidatus Liptonbacteria bacterium]
MIIAKPGLFSHSSYLTTRRILSKVRILAIETSCDETGLALLECSGPLTAPKIKLIKSVVASQVKVHAPYGGVVPTLAKREHVKNLPVLFRKLFPKIQVEVAGTESRPEFKFPNLGHPTTRSCDDPKIIPAFRSSQGTALNSSRVRKLLDNRNNFPVDEIAVTSGPGLEPALWMGITFAQDLGRAANVPVRGVNHLEGHLFSFLLVSHPTVPPLSKGRPGGVASTPYPLLATRLFPAVALIVSGGHTILLRLDSMSRWHKLGETRDDAAGEAYDKVARMLDLPYPGGPNLEKLAAGGNPRAVEFPRPMLHDKSYDFSFSGLKTSVLYHLRDHPTAHCSSLLAPRSSLPIKGRPGEVRPCNSALGRRQSAAAADVAAAFQQAVIDVLVGKTIRAARETGARSVILSGGVASNKALRRTLGRETKKIGCQYLVPPWKFNTDNAAMVGAAGYLAKLRRKNYPLRANGNLGI